MYTNWKIEKEKITDYVLQDGEAENPYLKEYSEVAQWCNDNQKYYIIEDGDVYRVEPIPEPTEEEKAAEVRAKRDSYLTQYVDPIVTNPLRWADMDEAEQAAVKSYRQYLLDIPQSEEFPNVEVLTFEAWKSGN